MKTVRPFAAAAAVLALLCASAANAQVLQSVPADALAVLKVKNLQDVSAKVAALSQKWALTNMVDQLNDPLAALQAAAGVGPGIDKAGEAAFVVLAPAAGGGEPLPLILVPVSDYKAFAGSLKNAKADGDFTQFTTGGSKPGYAADWGKYAAVSPNKEVVAKKPAGLQVAGLAAKELAGKDVVLFGNIKELRKIALPQLQKVKPQLLQELDRNLANGPNANAKFAPVVKAVVNQFLNVAEGFLTDCDAATFGINLSTEGISTTMMAEFRADSYAGKALATIKGTDASFTAGLPDARYFFYGGSALQGDAAKQMVSDFLAPIEKELNALGDEGKPIAAYISAVKEYSAETKQMNVGMVAPAANAIMAQEGVIQVVGIVKGDPAKLSAAQKKMMATEAEVMKLTGAGNMVKVTSTPNAKTVDGVSLDQFSTTFDIQPNTPQEQQVKNMMGIMYGAKGLNRYIGAVGPDTMVSVIGGTDALLTTAIQAAKAGEDPVGKGVAAKVTAALPQNRIAAYYLPVDTIATTVFDVMAVQGVPLGVKLPPNLPPLGAVLATEGSAVRFDGFIPSQTVESLVSAAMQIQLKRMQGGGAGQPGGL